NCGKGKDVVPEFRKERARKSAIPYATRIAIGPLYGIPYVENVGGIIAGSGALRPLGLGKLCQKCGSLGKPKLPVCGGCKRASYCSAGCQKAGWKTPRELVVNSLLMARTLYISPLVRL
ncbi:hypothetical protein BDM02DRAFT_3098232, partial [Thelephora ganbajun]